MIELFERLRQNKRPNLDPAILEGLTQEKTPLQRIASGVGRFGKMLTHPELVAKEDSNNDLEKIYAQEAIKAQFEDPTIRQLREAEIAALQAPPPRGFLRVGKQTLPDPDYIDPLEQSKLNEEKAKAADDARQLQSQTESIRGAAEQNLSSIAEAKKGSRYFGMLGGLPSIIAPSTIFSVGKDFGDRKMWENNINQLLSQKVVDLITQMKQASKTGATGFGSLTEKEGAMLREASTALSRDLPEDKALYYLNKMEEINKRILSGNSQPMQSTQPIQQPNQSQQAPQLSDEEAYRIYLASKGRR